MGGRIAITANEHFTERHPASGEVVYQCVAAYEDQPGLVVVNRGWHSLRKAQLYARSVNEARGLTDADVLEIFTSALRMSDLMPRTA